MIEFLFPTLNIGDLTFFGAVAAFCITFLMIKLFKDKLPTDIGRAYAVNAAAAKGKPRGAGIIFVIVFAFVALLFTGFSIEGCCYIVLLLMAMMSGFLDDASRAPWGEFKKGLIDLVISFLVTLTYVLCNGSTLSFFYFGTSFELPMWLYLILGTVLVWASINVTNCTDGVDGLSSSLSLISLGSFYILITKLGTSAVTSGTGIADFRPWILILMGCIAAYLLFNASPSIILMGDAGSRTIGVFFAIAAMKSGAPLMFLLICLVFIIDGGLGLIKVSAIRYLKLKNFMANVRTPIHDHARKKNGWSDTQTVIRFCIFQLIIAFIALF